MLSSIVSMLILVNPLALFVYLGPIIRELDAPSFRGVLMRASWISLALLLMFAGGGGFIFDHIFHIRFGSFRIFGGLVIACIALIFIVRGRKTLITLKPDLDAVAAEIALPYMVGAGSISLSILLSKQYGFIRAAGAIVVAMAVNYAAILALLAIWHYLPARRFRVAFGKLMGILLRINGFFMGAIGVDMVVRGIQSVIAGQ